MGTKISELTAAVTLTGTELVEIVQTSSSVRSTAQAVANTASSVTLGNTGLKVYDTAADHALSIVPGENLTAARTLQIVTGDADRTITLTTDVTLPMYSSYMGIYFSSTAATTISDANYTKAAGTTTVTNKSTDMDDASSTSNRIRYTGATARHFHIVAQTTITPASGTNQKIGVQVWHYDDSGASGSLLAHSEARTTVGSTAEEQITTHADVILDTNDYIEIHVANKTATNNITVVLGYMFAMGMAKAA